MTITPDLFTPLQLGPITLPNRVIMAPMTRCRAGAGNVPREVNARYYAQRASAGLIISEATQVSPQGTGYPGTPGMHSPQQVAGWKRVTDAVHAAGGRIFAQLWHVGRISPPAFQPNGELPVSASAVAAKGTIQTPDGLQPFPTPRALKTEEIAGVIDQFRKAAQNALAAGFDGVELHGANGYLPDQFLRDGVNYGGSIENRARFHLEVTAALTEVWGPDRVGVRLSPSGAYNDMRDSNPRATFGYLITELGKLGLAYLHIMEAMEGDLRHGGDLIPVSHFRPMFKGTLITNAGFTFEKSQHYLAQGHADAVAFGVPFLANPDLPERFRRSAPLNAPDPATFYGGSEKGYTDYPFLNTAKTANAVLA
jgi:N-ethylmaleimide reductase